MAARRPTEQAYELIRGVRSSDQFAWWEWSIPDNLVTASPRKIVMPGYDFAAFEGALNKRRGVVEETSR